MESVLIAVSPLGQPPHPTKGRDESMSSPHTAALLQQELSNRHRDVNSRTQAASSQQMTPGLLAWLPQGWGSHGILL